MAAPELAAYVREARAARATDEQIQQALLGAGWDQLDITNALSFTPTSEAQAAMAKGNKFRRLLEGFGRLISRLVLLFEVLLILRVIGFYVGVDGGHWLRFILFLPTDWAVVPWQSLTGNFIRDGNLFGASSLPLSSLLLLPGGMLDFAGLTAAVVYGLAYLILATLVKRLYRLARK